MWNEDELRTDEYTRDDGGTVSGITRLPSRISARDDEFDKPVMERLASLRRRLEVCVDALTTSGIEA